MANDENVVAWQGVATKTLKGFPWPLAPHSSECLKKERF
jgi:hypothetical protein